MDGGGAEFEVQRGKGGEGPDADQHRCDEHHVDDLQLVASQDIAGDQGDQPPQGRVDSRTDGDAGGQFLAAERLQLVVAQERVPRPSQRRGQSQRAED